MRRPVVQNSIWILEPSISGSGHNVLHYNELRLGAAEFLKLGIGKGPRMERRRPPPADTISIPEPQCRHLPDWVPGDRASASAAPMDTTAPDQRAIGENASPHSGASW